MADFPSAEVVAIEDLAAEGQPGADPGPCEDACHVLGRRILNEKPASGTACVVVQMNLSPHSLRITRPENLVENLGVDLLDKTHGHLLSNVLAGLKGPALNQPVKDAAIRIHPTGHGDPNGGDTHVLLVRSCEQLSHSRGELAVEVSLLEAAVTCVA